jgi:hypothetical protein
MSQSGFNSFNDSNEEGYVNTFPHPSPTHAEAHNPLQVNDYQLDNISKVTINLHAWQDSVNDVLGVLRMTFDLAEVQAYFPVKFEPVPTEEGQLHP